MKNFAITLIVLALAGALYYALSPLAAKHYADTKADDAPLQEEEAVVEAIVGVGETQRANGVSITLNEVVQDYRCPSDMECMEGGGIVTNVTLERNGIIETRNIPSDEVAYIFEGKAIAIIEVAPELFLDQPIPPSAYRVSFSVENHFAQE